MSDDGVFNVFKDERESISARNALIKVPSMKKYYHDQDYILSVCSEGPTKSFAFRRLRFLESKFHMYVLLNEYQELADSKVIFAMFDVCRKYHIETFTMFEKWILIFIIPRA